jgi:hypothetical protein
LHGIIIPETTEESHKSKFIPSAESTPTTFVEPKCNRLRTQFHPLKASKERWHQKKKKSGVRSIHESSSSSKVENATAQFWFRFMNSSIVSLRAELQAEIAGIMSWVSNRGPCEL